MRRLTNAYLHGLPVTLFDQPSLIEFLQESIAGKRQQVCFGYSLTILPKFRECPEIFTLSKTFDIFLADGKGIYWLFKLFGVPVASDMSLPDLAVLLLDLADRQHYRLLLLGADQTTNAQATANIRAKYPGAVIVEGIDGYFTPEDEPSVVSRINQLQPDILLIGISSPKKERFAHDWRSHLTAAVIVPCGGVIDILANKTSREPPLVKQLALTWLYRFAQEPRRLFRPLLVGGFSVIFGLIPTLVFQRAIKRNQQFSIPAFYGVSDESPIPRSESPVRLD